MRRLTNRRFATAMGWAFLSLMTVAASAPTRAISAGDLSGRVRDSVGNGLSGVEILVVPPSRAVDPVAVVRSDVAGKFSFSGLEPGSYRIAALKSGYRTFVGEVNTRAQGWLDVVLQLAPAVSAEPEARLPRDVSWSLRLPRRSVLRETDAQIPIPRDSEATPSASPAVGQRELRVEVEQLFGVRQGPRDEMGQRPQGLGLETKLRLDTSIGTRGRVGLSGVRQQFDTSPASAESTAAARERAASMAVDFSYDPTLDSEIEFRAIYDERELRRGSPRADSALAEGALAVASWSGEASWAMQLDARSRVSVRLDYRGSVLETPEGWPWPSSGEAGAGAALSSRSLGAAGFYESMVGRDHRVQVGFRARSSGPPLPGLLVPGATPVGDPLAQLTGLSYGLDAQDTWHLGGALALFYGLGYRQATTGRDPSWITPRFGGNWSGRRVAARFQLSYHGATSREGGDEASSDAPFRPASPVGYRAEITLPLFYDLRFTAATRSTPVQFDVAEYAGVAEGPGRHPIYLTDGNAAVDEHRVALVREDALLLAYLELASGSVRGTLAPSRFRELPVAVLSDGRMNYLASRLGLRVAASGTDVLLDYREVDAVEFGRGDPGGDSSERSLGLRVCQDLLRHGSVGDWRLLVALRLASLQMDPAADPAPPGDDAWLQTSDHELSAGLSVLF